MPNAPPTEPTDHYRLARGIAALQELLSRQTGCRSDLERRFLM